MLLVSAVQIVLGWAWHVGFRARPHWSLRREGALAAAALAALAGAYDLTHGRQAGPAASGPLARGDRFVATTPAATAPATPVITEAARPMEIEPTADASEPQSVETIPAAPSPQLAEKQASDPIGDKILERLGDGGATASVPTKQKKVRIIKTTSSKSE